LRELTKGAADLTCGCTRLIYRRGDNASDEKVFIAAQNVRRKILSSSWKSSLRGLDELTDSYIEIHDVGLGETRHYPLNVAVT
jgi:hypothetical protein